MILYIFERNCFLRTTNDLFKTGATEIQSHAQKWCLDKLLVSTNKREADLDRSRMCVRSYQCGPDARRRRSSFTLWSLQEICPLVHLCSVPPSKLMKACDAEEVEKEGKGSSQGWMKVHGIMLFFVSSVQLSTLDPFKREIYKSSKPCIDLNSNKIFLQISFIFS